MGSKYVEKIRHDPGCGGGGLQIFLDPDGTYRGWCFSCKSKVTDPYGDKPEGWVPPKPKLKITPEERAEKIADIQSWGVSDLPTRHLKREYLEYLGIKVGVSQEDGITPAIAALPIKRDGDIVSYKLRLLDEKRMCL